VDVKNYRGLIDAFSTLLRQTSRPLRLRLLGGGPLEPALKQQVLRLGAADAVQFCGGSRNVAAFLSDIDVFVLSSLSEGLPLTLLEAMASGRPVVATEVGGVPSVVRASNAGWLCRPGDIDALIDALRAAFESRDRGERGQNARRFVTER